MLLQYGAQGIHKGLIAEERCSRAGLSVLVAIADRDWLHDRIGVNRSLREGRIERHQVRAPSGGPLGKDDYRRSST
ncbi:MAG TPA: hypothetical protein VNU00_09030 [Candidatus Binataceae bacterium]|nr:hypothetical protein [Candidatus Binataceae bacterium]